MCLYSNIVQNPKYKMTKKNGGVIPAINDIRVTKVPIGCGNCMECRNQKKREWQIRLQEDIKEYKNGKFVTLTMSNESYAKIAKEIKGAEGYEMDNAVMTRAVRLWTERWRKKNKKTIRHWLVSELGHEGTENIHMHGIVWTDDIEEVRSSWGYGYIYPRTKEELRKNYVNARTVNYTIKYISKVDEDHKTYKSIILTSNGIGGSYINRYNSRLNKYKPNGKTDETYRTETGHRISLPIYWRNKIYSEEEREKLWIEKMNKNERWVGGEKIKADDTNTYYDLLQWYRKINAELGYGTNEKDWNREQYERERRIIINETRIKKAEEARIAPQATDARGRRSATDSRLFIGYEGAAEGAATHSTAKREISFPLQSGNIGENKR